MSIHDLPQTSYPGQLGSQKVRYREFNGRSPGCTSDGSFGPTGCTATMTYDIPFDSLWTFIGCALGYTQVIGLQPYRYPPAVHPLFSWLYATRVTKVEGIQPQTVLQNAYGPYTEYGMARVTIGYEGRKYAVIPNRGIDATGYTYYMEKQHQPTSEFITRENGSFSWLNSAEIPTGPKATNTVVAQQGQLINKVRFPWVWHEIPARTVGGGLLDSYGNSPNIDNAVGTVNAGSFLGLLPGTVLLESANFEPYPMQWDNNNGGNNVNGQPSVYYRVTFNFIYFNPPTDEVEGYYGWNLAPWPDGYWYQVYYRLSGGSEIPKYMASNFANLFILNA